MENLEEFRYPFTSTLEFFGSYWRETAAFHLDFAWICLSGLALRVLLRPGPLSRKLLALYFGLTIFNNFAFQFVPGATLGDVFGVLCALLGVIEIGLKKGFRVRYSPVAASILCAGLVIALHAVIVSAFYPILNADGAGITRSLILLKVFVLGVCCCMFEEHIVDQHDCDWLVRQVVNFAMIGIAAYGIQIAVLLSGVVPYGTFLDAGYVGFPSFGSVSIERGHFGKFMTPLFPLFLLSLLKKRRRFAFISLVLVTLANFSASSLSYFAFYVAHAALQFKKNLLKLRYAVVALAAVGTLSVFVACTWSLWIGLIDKLNDQAVQGGGGRSAELLITYLQHFPLGLSYGGSTLRTAPNLEEMNSGLYSFIAQLSFLALPLIGAFFCLVFASVRICNRIPDSCTRHALKTGILVMPFIFFSDLLWFVPTIWLPMLLVYRLSRTERIDPNSFRTTSKIDTGTRTLSENCLGFGPLPSQRNGCKSTGILRFSSRACRDSRQ